jgi:hypothetical protein
MPYFEITDGNGISHTVDLLSNDATDIKGEFKKFEAKKRAKKENKETPPSLKALFGDQIEFKKSSLFDNDNKKGDIKNA